MECCIEKFLQSARHLEGYFSKYQMYSTVNHPQDAIREVILHNMNNKCYLVPNVISIVAA